MLFDIPSNFIKSLIIKLVKIDSCKEISTFFSFVAAVMKEHSLTRFHQFKIRVSLEIK
jgi:hypothetical protein